MSSRRGRRWTWEAWDAGLSKAREGKSATASALAALCFFALLSLSAILKAVSPTPAEMDEYPMLVAKRAAAKRVFADLYMADCEQAALGTISEPFRLFARKTGFYSAEAFPSAIECLDARLMANGLSSLDVQLRAERSMAALLDLSCVGDLRQTELCSRAFAYAQNKGNQVGAMVADRLAKSDGQGFVAP